VKNTQLQTLKQKRYMNKDLIERIKQFNEIKFGNDNPNETRIIIAKLKPQGTVTTAPK
tara:strand:- start:880 stop:1053 length:174 start_codon:yes stop_codon:yes gene_type:complete